MAMKTEEVKSDIIKKVEKFAKIVGNDDFLDTQKKLMKKTIAFMLKGILVNKETGKETKHLGTTVTVGLHCPNCGAKYECPCPSCNKDNKSGWKFVGDDRERCPCGFIATIDWWEELELQIWRRMKDKVGKI